MMWTRWARLFLVAVLLGCSGADDDGASGARTSEESDEILGDVLLERVREPFQGDLPELRKRRVVRALVSYSKTNFFYDEGEARGFEVEMLREWEKSLNEGLGTYDRIKVVLIPTPFDRIFADLEAGKGDIAAAGLSVTPERAKRAAFTEPYVPNVREVVVVNRKTTHLSSVEDLAGKRVLVRAGSSYAYHLEERNRELEGSTGRSIEIEEADRRLATEDILEMVHAGAVEITVVDLHLAEAWAAVLPQLVVREDLVVHSGGEIAWAVQKGQDELLAHLNAHIRKNRKGSLLGNVFFNRYHSGSAWIRNPAETTELEKLEEKIDLFQKYAAMYDFEWLALAAQAYQESRLDQSMRSRAGAVGVMQLLPTTAADKSVGIENVHILENNIHAGAKYLAFLRDRYFNDPDIEPAARVDFAWAAYNAGPARVRQLREKAAARGLNPNRWFSHVEQIAAEEIGRETVDYVRNINKYYLAYRLQYESYRQRKEARDS